MRRDRGPRSAARATLAPVVLLLGALAGFAPRASAQTVEDRIAATADRIDRARAESVGLLAPQTFERAEKRLDDARSLLRRGGRIDEIDQRLQEANLAVTRADSVAETTRPILADALSAREAAARAGAPDFATRSWNRAEDALVDAARRAEEGDADAGERARRAEGAFRQAETDALRADVLGRAREKRSAAADLGAERRVPRTWSRADSLLAEAERRIDAGAAAGDLSAAREIAEEAAAEYDHAARLAVVADSAASRRLTYEDLLLRGERRLARVAEALDFQPRFGAGSDSVAAAILTAIRSLEADRAGLQRDVQGRDEEIARLEAEIDSLDTRLAALEARSAEVTAQLRERERAERRLREAQALFTPEEAEVLVSANRLDIRMYGLTFPSGSAEIRPENFSLLTKLERVIRDFPEARVTVEGHTDNVGSEAANQALSQQRAIAVRDYLLEHLALSSSRISAVGYGDSRPIASNATAEGRAKNRRIDVTLDLGPG